VFVGRGQLHVLPGPVVDVVSVTGFTRGVDWEFVRDVGALGGSVRGRDGIVWLIGGTLPTVGASVTVTYQRDTAVVDAQTWFDAPLKAVLGRDLLVHRATPLGFSVAATLTVVYGYAAADVQAAVTRSITEFFAQLRAGDAVQESDIVRWLAGERNGRVLEELAVPGIDNLVFTRLGPTSQPGFVGDWTPALRERAALDTIAISI
jgi:hypothetical protein